jgi:hypothetical protein
MPNFNNLRIYRLKEILNITRNIFNNDEPTFYEHAIRGPDPELWHSAIEIEIDALQRNYTGDVIDRPTDTMIVDSK